MECNQLKVCSKCKKEKLLKQFGKEKAQKDGLKTACKVCRNIQGAEWRSRNKEHAKNWREDNAKYVKEYYSRADVKNRKNEYCKTRRKKDPVFKLAYEVRIHTNRALKNKGKNKKTAELLGCSFEELKAHIERQFNGDMSWDNHGQWHIDHIKPLALAKTKKEAEKLCHYTNLQPLWAKENLSKGAKYVETKRSKTEK
jgi:5-methylcytosine-specific restriction endonuclease McrA